MSATIKQLYVSNNVGVACYCYTFCLGSVLIGLWLQPLILGQYCRQQLLSEAGRVFQTCLAVPATNIDPPPPSPALLETWRDSVWVSGSGGGCGVTAELF